MATQQKSADVTPQPSARSVMSGFENKPQLGRLLANLNVDKSHQGHLKEIYDYVQTQKI